MIAINGVPTTAGKTIGSRTYFHVSLLPEQAAEIQARCESAIRLAQVEPGHDFNVVRLDSANGSVALLDYPLFFEEAFPALARSWKVGLEPGRCVFRSYQDSLNPPILHRKELLLRSTHPQLSIYSLLTEEAERIGLFDDPIRIGFKLQWNKLLTERGFRVVDHQLVPIGNVEITGTIDEVLPERLKIERHRTALSRTGFSAPIHILGRYGFLDGSRTLFDYGCGKGDDIRGLIQNGITAQGWDPHYAPDSPISAAGIVNLGFVINVIEDPVERRDSLQRAFALADELLVVSTMVATENPGKVTFFGDGILTSRSTFQKYYTQAELREYLASVLAEDPIPVAPGIFFVFKDKQTEQRFQVGRYRSRIRIIPLCRPERLDRQIRTRRAREPAPDKYEIHRALLDVLWAQCLDLGREPDEEEVQNLKELDQTLGSLKKALRLVLSRNDPSLLERARRQRADDLRVFLALQQFQRRKPYKQLEPQLQKDVRAFFGDYTSAQEHAKHLLYEVSRPEVLDEACRTAAEQGLGWLEPSHSLQLHSSLVPRLPGPLRVYVGCASVLYGDVKEADLVKLHIRSGKVSFMKYDNFFGSALPRMTERTKVNLRNLDLQVFAYGGEYPCPLLYLKSRYINEELPNYAEQLEFDEALKAHEIADLSGFGPTEAEFFAALHGAHWKIEGFRFERLHLVPNLDERCGRYLTYRQLIECGETQASNALPNVPKTPETYTALFELAINILDPVIEYFGGIQLTYGFCSQELAKRISARIAPELDQHAAHEKKRTGAPICTRLGAAVDFLVRDESMREVAEWVVANLPFDRLYYYGPDRPLHVSYGPEHKREAIEMVPIPKGHQIPRPLRTSFTSN